MTNERAPRIVDAPADESSTDSIAPPPIDRADQESQLEPSLPVEDSDPNEDTVAAEVDAASAAIEAAETDTEIMDDDSPGAETSAEIDAPESLVELGEDDDQTEIVEPAPETDLQAVDEASEDPALEDADSEDDESDGEVSPAEALPHLLEALLFVADEPIAPSALGRALDRTPRQVRRGLDDLADTLREGNRGVRLQQGPDGAQLVTAPEAANAVEFFLGLEANRRLSNAALETLAIIAYRQPVTRLGIEQIRGVSSDGAVATLRARGLIEGIGRAPGPGRPLLFSTTQRFLEHFGLERPDELPPLPEDVELPPEDGGSQLVLETADGDEVDEQPTADRSEVETDSELEANADLDADAGLDGETDLDEGTGDAEVIEDSLDDDAEFEPFGVDDEGDLEISDDVDDLSRAAGAALAAPTESTEPTSADD